MFLGEICSEMSKEVRITLGSLVRAHIQMEVETEESI